MIEKNSLFYMANLYPEIGRMFSFLDANKTSASMNAQKRSLDLVDKILSFDNFNKKEKQSWHGIRELIVNYNRLNTAERNFLEKYAETFSYKFMNAYSG